MLEVRHNSYSNISEATKNISKSLDYADVNNDQEIVIKHFSFGKEIISEELLSKKLYEKHKSKNIRSIYKEQENFPLVKTSITPSVRTLLAARKVFFCMVYF